LATSSRNNPWSHIPTHILPSIVSYTDQARFYHQRSTDAAEAHARSSTNADRKEKAEAESALPTASDPDLPHLTPSQNVHMTHISQKTVTSRQATATGLVYFSNSRPWDLLREGQGTHKGDVYSVARIAGIMAAKRTPDVVPLCHPGIGITGVEVDVKLLEPVTEGDEKMKYGAMSVKATVGCLGRTGVEMEAMTATMGAALTVYDMLKAVDKGMVIGRVQLEEKKGGKSGHWVREREIGH